MELNPIRWTLAELGAWPKHGLRVASTFAAGGGSSMGYKLAGFRVVAANDIDPEMASHYRRNLDVPHYFLGPIRDLLEIQVPPELEDLDILDGSPPCSTFSTAGLRERYWGKAKKFREGQATQVLSDLFFDWLDVVERFRPKVAVAENVRGMILGNAKGYVRQVFERLASIGYDAQLFLVNGADCGVPQRRERVFFVARRRDLGFAPLVFRPRHPWRTVAEACADLYPISREDRADTRPGQMDLVWWGRTPPGRSYAHAASKFRGKHSLFNIYKLDGERPANTLTSSRLLRHWDECRLLTWGETRRIGAFPDDYKVNGTNVGTYIVGMSVPPYMTATVAKAIATQWLGVGADQYRGCIYGRTP